MRISVITPTCDRPAGIALAERYMARQTVQPDEWIVADSGQQAAPLSMGQQHIRRPMPPGARNLAGNIIAALDAAKGHAVIVWEDDDWYAPSHIEACLEGLRSLPAYGCATLRYYNVAHRMHIRMSNNGAALCQTAFRRSLLTEMRAAAAAAHAANDFLIDGRFWSPRRAQAVGQQTVIGIKGLPGTPGLGIGHRPKLAGGRPWQSDRDGHVLREWIGADAESYLC